MRLLHKLVCVWVSIMAMSLLVLEVKVRAKLLTGSKTTVRFLSLLLQRWSNTRAG